MIGRGIVNRLRNIRLARNIGALGYGQLIMIVGQLLLVPVFAINWGLERYGVWLLLFTIPTYLSASDLGLTSAATSDMIMARAKGEKQAVARTFVTMRKAQFAMGLGVVAIGVAVLFAIAPGLVAFAQKEAGGMARPAALAMIAYGALSLQQAGLLGGMKVADRFASATAIQGTGYGIETLVAAALVMAGQGILGVALGYLLVRLIMTFVIGRYLGSMAPWLVDGQARFSGHDLRRLARPALAAMSLTLGMAASIQVMTVIVGARAGIAAVPVFATVRTLTRLGFQLTAQVSAAAMPLFGVARSTGRRADQAALLILSLGTALAVLVPALLVLVAIGPNLVDLWTGGSIHPSRALVAAMGTVMLLDGISLALSNMLLAINRHESYAVTYLVLSAGALGLAWWWSAALGPLGAALALVVLDALVLVQLIRSARHHNLLESNALAEGAAVLRQRWQALRGGV